MLEAKDQAHKAQVFSPPKKGPQKNFSGDFQKKRSFQQIFREVSAVFQGNVKRRSWPWPIFNKSKKSCPRAEDRTFSRTCILRGQFQELDL